MLKQHFNFKQKKKTPIQKNRSQESKHKFNRQQTVLLGNDLPHHL